MNCIDCSTCTKEHRLNQFEIFKDSFKSIQTFDYNSDIYSHPINILLGLTNRCNLNCSYCFVHQNNQDMSLQTAEQALKWAQNNAISENQKISIGFFGGEPLLKFDDIIQPLVEKYADTFNWSITTNGVLLSEDIVDFFYKYQVTPLLSFDGIPQIQNLQRSNSFNQVLKNIPYLLLRFPDTTMRATVTKESIPFLYDTVLMAEEIGFNNIFFCEDAFEDWDLGTERVLYDQLNKIGLYIYKKLFNNEPAIKINPFLRIFKSISLAQTNNLFFNNDISRCGLGTESCAIAPNGDIIPCQEKLSTPVNNIGNIFQGIDYQKHSLYLNNYFQKVNNIQCDKKCSDKQKIICLSHLCPSRLEDLNYQISTASCAFSRMATQVVLRLHALCAYNSKINIREYFEQEDIEWNLNQSELEQ